MTDTTSNLLPPARTAADAAPSASPAPPTPVLYRRGQAMRWLVALARNVQIGSITFVFPDGTTERMQGPEPGPDSVFRIHRDRVARRFIMGGTLGFCESYLDGDWSSPDMECLFVWTLLNETRLTALLEGKRWYRGLRTVSHVLRRNNRRGAKRNIAYHYDLGNAFYEKWLDPGMTYSSALFDAAAGDSDDLDAAQHNKYAALAKRLDLRSGHRMLEIGCGWGGFAEFAAGEIGAHVTAITISREQHAYTSERIRRAGLADRVDVRLQDYREVEGRFDRIASIEMFEAVGEAYWPQFFATVHDRLDGGIAALQIITIADRYFDEYRRKADYIQKYIFPGGMLPSETALARQVRGGGLKLGEITRFGEDYARTLRLWNRRFQAAWPDIEALGFDGRFKRMWEQYLLYCAAGFTVGTIDVVQLAMARD